MASSREIVKKASRSAAEAALRAAMPELGKQIGDLDARLTQIERTLDTRFHQLEQKIEDRFERLLDAINQLHDRVMRVEAKVDAYVDITRHSMANTQNLVERIVRLEMSQGGKRRRAS
jgi:uncharacterized protein YdcH (DUF465 family)